MIEFDLDLKRGNFQLQASLNTEASVIGLFGPSGSGKSTLLSLLTGSLQPQHGRIVVDGRCLLDTARHINIPVHQRRIGMVYQEGRLFPHLNVRHNLSYGLQLLKPAQRRFKLDDIVALLELGPLLEQRPRQLSGGEQQRVALGRALLAAPQLLLLDEPMAALDDRLKAQILPFLRRIKDETGVPMLYVSHALHEILTLTQYIAIMQTGRLLAHGDSYGVLGMEHVLPLTQSLGLENLLKLQLLPLPQQAGCSVALCGQQQVILPHVEAPAGSEISVVIPASSIALARQRIEGISIQNQLHGTIRAIRMHEQRALLSIDVGAELLVEITEKSRQDMGLQCGDSIYCLFKTQAIRLLGHQRKA